MVKMIGGLGGKLLVFLRGKRRNPSSGRCIVYLDDGTQCPTDGEMSYGGRPHCPDHYAQRFDSKRPRVRTPPILIKNPRKK